jgi:hypothetical protein
MTCADKKLLLALGLCHQICATKKLISRENQGQQSAGGVS